MKINKVYNLYFSPTGGTERAVELLGSAWGECEDIDLSVFRGNYEKYELRENELCIIGVPAFGGRVPKAALDNLAQVKAHNTPAVLVVAYGNRAYDDTFLELKETAEAAGFVCASAVAAVTEHSIARQYGTGRPDAQDAQVLKDYGMQIKQTLEQAEIVHSIDVPGKKPYREFGGVPVKPKATRKCTSCKVCANRCPVGAISLDNPKETDEEKCISCMRCIAVCPVNARKCNPLMMMIVGRKLKKVCEGRKENELFL